MDLSANELAWLVGLLAGHFSLGFVVTICLKRLWRNAEGYFWPIGSSILANVMLAASMTIIEFSHSVAEGLTTVSGAIAPGFIMATYLSTVFCFIGVGASFAGYFSALQLSRIIRPET